MTPPSGLAELARRGEVELVERPYRRGDLVGALLVFATGDPSGNAAGLRRRRSRRGAL